MNHQRFDEIDWNRLRQQYRSENLPQKKDSRSWNTRAASFAARNEPSIYTEKFIELLKPQPEWSVLDVGCGPGTLALPLAARVRHVTALDFSENMLALLGNHLKQRQIANITPHLLSWEDDWQGVPIHDVALASRSLNVDDLKGALNKLIRHARQAVFVTDRVGTGPYDPLAFKAVGRPLRPGPDYIFTVNLLYQMGHYAQVTFIRTEEWATYSCFQEALSAYSWMFPGMSAGELEKLEHYVAALCEFLPDGSVTLYRRHIPTWAFLSWQLTGLAPQHPARCKTIRNNL